MKATRIGKKLIVMLVVLAMVFSAVFASAVSEVLQEETDVTQPERELRVLRFRVEKEVGEAELVIRRDGLRWELRFPVPEDRRDGSFMRTWVDGGLEWHPFEGADNDEWTLSRPFPLEALDIHLQPGWILEGVHASESPGEVFVEEHPGEGSGDTGRIRLGLEPGVYEFDVIFWEGSAEPKEVAVVVLDETGESVDGGYVIHWYRDEEKEPFYTGNPAILPPDYEYTVYYFMIELDDALKEIYMIPGRHGFDAQQTDQKTVTLFQKSVASYVLTVRANIDMYSELKFGNGKIWWHHKTGAAPGRHYGMDEPTIINGFSWMPWQGIPGELYEDIESAALLLKPSIGLDLDGAWELVGINVSEARGSVTVSQYPSAENEYTGAVTFDDIRQFSDAWYEVQLLLRFSVPPAPSQYTISVSAGAGGTATGGGTYAEETTVKVTAAPDEGYTFDGWYENDAKIGGDAEYVFTVDQNRSLEARFTEAAVPTIDISIDSRLIIEPYLIPDENSESFNPKFLLSANQPIAVALYVASYDTKSRLVVFSAVSVDLTVDIVSELQAAIPYTSGAVNRFFIWDSNYKVLTDITSMADLAVVSSAA
ncbi:MAG: hypothetical protein LBK75_01265 [Oscillospiraceae bacterium]|jgi:hypothetical protein|nr:hypothetical protein [Oscillospiraceae bacterium]